MENLKNKRNQNHLADRVAGQTENNGACTALKDELEQLKNELAEEKNRHLRTRADFDNYRKRVARDFEATKTEIKREILVDLLHFLDYFEQALKQVQDPGAAGGLKIMSRQFNEFLQKQGVEPVECLGLPFNPEEQEGLGFIVTDRCPEGCVAEEVCPGYRLSGTLLKPSKVLVAKKEEAD